MQLEATATAVTNSPAFTADDVARFYANGWWTGTTISDAVRVNATRTPDRAAYVDHPDRSLSWREFDTGKRTIPAIATLHPAYLLRQPAQKKLAWKDFRAIRDKLAGLNLGESKS